MKKNKIFVARMKKCRIFAARMKMYVMVKVLMTYRCLRTLAHEFRGGVSSFTPPYTHFSSR